MKELVVRRLGELLDAVTPEHPHPETGRFRDTGIYRGMRDAGRPLLTSLDRLGGIDPPHTKAGLEGHVLRNFIRYSRPYLPTTPASDWELLVTAQHHGVPTRLLDWTYSPLVAAHFATQDSTQGGDRVIWRLDWQRVHRAFDFPPLALSIQDVEGAVDGDGPFTPWRLFEGDVGRPFACMLEPPSIDARIVAQSAVFTFCTTACQTFDDFLAEHGLEDALVRYLIPGECAQRLRDQLETAAVDERRLFPDLDGVAAAIRRYYA